MNTFCRVNAFFGFGLSSYIALSALTGHGIPAWAHTYIGITLLVVAAEQAFYVATGRYPGRPA